MENTKVPNGYYPFMYSTRYLLHKIENGDILTLKFGEKKYKVKKDFVNKTIDFVVVDYREHCFPRLSRILALVPVEKLENFEDKDVLFLADTYCAECLMCKLFPCNRKPYAGWKNKIVTIIEVQK